MVLLDFLKEYWVLITFCVGEIAVLVGFMTAIIKSVKCVLRNDILDIYDRCKESKKITRYQLQSITYSYELYKKLKGNSFVEEIIERIHDFEEVD